MACVQMESRNARIRPKAAVNPDFPSSPEKKRAKRKASLILKDVGVCFKKSARILLSTRLKRSLTFCEISRIRCCGGDKVKDEKTLK